MASSVEGYEVSTCDVCKNEGENEIWADVVVVGRVMSVMNEERVRLASNSLLETLRQLRLDVSYHSFEPQTSKTDADMRQRAHFECTWPHWNRKVAVLREDWAARLAL